MSVNGILTGQQKSYTKAEEDALLATKQNTLTFDDTPTQDSDNPVKSSGIKTVIDNVVNGVTPVALAENLTSNSAQSSADAFIERTTGGTASLSDGDGWIQVVRGSHTHTGYVPSDVDITVTPVLHTLTGTIDQATFFAAVGDDSGTKTFTYTTNWDYNPVTYGITLTGSPLAGDQIVVTYDTNFAVSMTVNSPGEDITATIDEEDFFAQVSGSSGTITFTYTDNWDTNPATYGITVIGTPAENDSISVTYLITRIASMTVIPIYHSISAEIDEDIFLSEMSNTSGYMEFTYTTNWDYNPVTYGITVTGSPISGDKIRVDYIKETRGTITQSNPQSFKSSGWNLYNHTNGYARVLKYSETYGFGIAGTYTSLAFSSTISGTQTAVTVTNGRFTIPEDGYIFVTGGNNTDTQIWMTWSDWTSQANGGTWEAYTESTVDFSSVMNSYFPYGLLEVGTYQDEINFSSGIAINKVARIDYSLANLANVKTMNVDYEYDENYIYYGLSTPVTNSISVDNSVDAYDHGMEWFTETALAVQAQTIYGINLKNKLERDVLTISQQDLTNSDIAQVKENLKMSYICNKNLLDNWYFANPVNQRGSTSGTSNAAYFIDRWKTTNQSGYTGSWSLSTTGLTLTSASSAWVGITQTIDESQLSGKSLMFSVLYSDGTIKVGRIASRNISSTQTFSEVIGGEPGALLNTHSIRTTVRGTATIVAVKLEIGIEQTLAHQEGSIWVLNEIPDYEEELLRCQTSTADASDLYANKVVGVNVSNENLLRNWYFAGSPFPINQRGGAPYSGNAGYSIDRWYRRNTSNAGNPTLAIGADGIVLTTDGLAAEGLNQAVENKDLLAGKTVTLSALIESNTYVASCYLGLWAANGAGANSTTLSYIEISGQTGLLTITGTLPSTLTASMLICGVYSPSAAGSIKIKAVKLELGTKQTLAHRENGAWVLNDIPNYEEELVKCQTSTVDTSDTYANKPAGITALLGFWLDCGSISSLPVTISDSRITANHSVDAWQFGTMKVMGSPWTVMTAAGTATISGTIQVDTALPSTTLKLHLTLDQ